jgi:hypothetical protein
MNERKKKRKKERQKKRKIERKKENNLKQQETKIKKGRNREQFGMRGTSKQIKTKNLLKEEEKEEGIVL